MTSCIFCRIIIINKIKSKLPEVGDLQRSSGATVPSLISHRPAKKQNQNQITPQVYVSAVLPPIYSMYLMIVH